jgi:hypothetical protein
MIASHSYILNIKTKRPFITYFLAYSFQIHPSLQAKPQRQLVIQNLYCNTAPKTNNEPDIDHKSNSKLLAAAFLFFEPDPDEAAVPEASNFVTSVVVIVVTNPATVLAGIVIPPTTEAGPVCVDREVTSTTTCTKELETTDDIVDGYRIVSETTTPGTVVGRIVLAGMVLPGIVVVYVTVILPPRALAGIAVPTPEAVNWLGRGRVAVFGVAAGLFEYIFPV